MCWLFNCRHVGDLGNIEADSNGVANINIVDRMVKLYGPISVDGRSFVVCVYSAITYSHHMPMLLILHKNYTLC